MTTAEEFDALDWALSRMRETGCDEADDAAIKAVLHYLINNADYNAIEAAGRAALAVEEQWDAQARRGQEELDAYRALREHQLASTCPRCGAAPGEQCRTPSGAEAGFHAKRGRTMPTDEETR